MMRNLLTVSAAALLGLSGTVHAVDLLGVYTRARSADPQILAARAAHAAALEAEPQARSAFLPKLSATGRRSHTQSDVNDSSALTLDNLDYDETSYALNLTQPIFHYDYFMQYGQANSRVAQADAELAAAQQTLIVRVAEAYFSRLGAEDNLRLARAERNAIEQQLRQARQRFEVGLTAVTDLREAQARFDLAVAQAIAAENQLDIARERLSEITGEPYESLSPLGEVPLVGPEPADQDQWVKRALEQNLQLLSAQAGTEIARREVTRRRAGHFPTLDLIASYGHSRLPDLGRDNDDKVVSLQLSLPLFQGGFTSSRTREAEQLHNQSLALLEQQRRATVRQTRDSYLAIQAGISQVQALRQALESARTALEATEVGYRVGTRTAVDVLDAQRQLFLAERNYSSARYGYVIATLRLKQATGSVSENDLGRVNAWLATPGESSTNPTESAH